MLLVLLVFLTVNAVLYTVSAPEGWRAIDTGRYIAVARRLLAEGWPHSHFRLPVYPVFLAPFLAVTERIALPVVCVQVLLLFGTGVAARRLADRLVPGYGVLVLCLVVLSPSSVLAAHMVLPDTLFGFFFAAHALLLVESYRSGSARAALLAGVCGAMLALVRANGLLLVALMPVVLCVGCACVQQPVWRRGVLLSGVALATVAVVLAPWVLYQASATGQLCVVGPTYVDRAVHDNMVYLHLRAYGRSESESYRAVYARVEALAGRPAGAVAALDRVGRQQVTARHAWRLLRSYPVVRVARAVGSSLAAFVFSSGNTALLRYLGADDLGNAELGRAYAQGRATLATPNRRLASLVLFPPLVAVRLLAAIGLCGLLLRRQWETVVLCVLWIGIFAAAMGFLCCVRYRVPVEPLFMVLTACGVGELRRVFTRSATGVRGASGPGRTA